MTIDPARAKSLFLVASDLSDPAERAAYLDRECGDNAELRHRVAALLEANNAAPLPPLKEAVIVPTQFEAQPSPKNIVDDPTVSEGTILEGKYKLIQEIGVGGMGSVYMAQQIHPVKRPVAIKVIKQGMDSKAVLARFEAERQALAMMDHESIARVLDAGKTQSGRPFFVMELVKGQPITQFCDERKLTPRQRLELFVPVCHAIQHAHQKGVIHRDIKPSNVIVAMYDDHPIPKVIDFGLAKATGQNLTDKTLMTGFGAIVGTPEYMSPEQASLNNLDIDTRSDIYALGVLLYELLTGSTPVDRESIGKAALMEVLRIVREVEAPRMSVKLSSVQTPPSVARNRGTEPAKLSRLMKGELDWVVLKALNKDRTRRYETANGLAADIQRYLTNEPVVARPPSTVYRIWKTWQRNKIVVTAAFAIAVSLVLGIATSLTQMLRADHEARRATVALEELRDTAPAFVEQARSLAAREQFDEAIEKLDYATKLRPDIAEYLIAKADLLQCQFRLKDAALVYQAALTTQPDSQPARTNLELCEALLAAPREPDGRLSRESLSKLHLAMQQQQRPAAELMPVSRLLGEESKILVDYWLERLKGLPIPGDRPLSKRLTVGDDGLLTIDLSRTRVSNLSLIAGAPIASLDLSGASALESIEPLRGMKLTKLNIPRTRVKDLSPLTGMKTLESLSIGNTSINDLSALQDIPLQSLEMTFCPINDLAPLKGAPLKTLIMNDTRVTDLSPLSGMPLTYLDMGAVPVTDFTPLVGLPLEVLNIPGCQLTDLAVFQNLPLRELMIWNCRSTRNYAALSKIQTLELLTLPDDYRRLPANELAGIELLRKHPKLRQLGSETTVDHTTTRSTESFWKQWDDESRYFAALNKSPFQYSWNRFPNGTYQLNLEDQAFDDLSLFKGIPIVHLWLNGCQIRDLSGLKDLPLKKLGLTHNPVQDLTPISHLRLTELAIEGTGVRDLSPIRNMPLRCLYMTDTEITDISVLEQIQTLEKVTLPLRAQNVDRLKQLPNLLMMAYTRDDNSPWFPVSTAERFWEYDNLEFIKAIRQSAPKSTKLFPQQDGTFFVNCSSQQLSDISFLADANISGVNLGDTQVFDLTPLKNAPLKTLFLDRTEVSDLTPLEGLAITQLSLVGTKIQNVAPLRHLPLSILHLSDCNQLRDISPVADIQTLTELTIPQSVENPEVLRKLPNLRRLSYVQETGNGMRPDKTATEFWNQFDQRQAGERNAAAGKSALPATTLDSALPPAKQ